MPRRARRDPVAKQDIAELTAYLTGQSPAAAIRFVRHLRETIADLLRMPGLGSPFESAEPRLNGIRFMNVRGFPNHLVFYREAARGIEVLRVLHGSRDLARLLAVGGQSPDKP